MRVQDVPPGTTDCQNGGVVITSGLGVRPTVIRTNSLPTGSPLSAFVLSRAALNLDGTDSFISNDNHVLHLQDGTLYISWLYSSSAPLTPKPSWWDAVAGPPHNLPPGSRGSMLQLISSDCGNTWTRLPDLDSGVIDNGYWGWPQGPSNPWIGGWDRQEIYADPFNGRLYATIRATTSTLSGYQDHPDDAYLLFYSDDHGKNWTLSPMRFATWEPLSMTSTPSGRLFLAQCVKTNQGKRLIVEWIDPQDIGNSHSTGSTVIANGTGKFDECGTLPQSDLPAGVTSEFLANVSLSRIGANNTNSIRIAYPRVIDGRQVRFVMGLTFGADDNPLVVPLKVVRAHDNNGDILYASFIEPDGPEAKTTNVSVLYWLETTNAGKLMARYSAVKDGWEWTPPANLSIAGGTPYDWTPNDAWIGHYIRGGFHADATDFNYIALWPENGVPTMNIVRVPRNDAVSSTTKSAQWSSASPVQPADANIHILASPHQDRGGLLNPSE